MHGEHLHDFGRRLVAHTEKIKAFLDANPSPPRDPEVMDGLQRSI